MTSHPLPRLQKSSKLLLPGTNPIPSARNGFVPFFFPSREAVNRSYSLGEAQTYAATPQHVLQAVPQLLHPSTGSPEVSLGLLLGMESGFAQRQPIPWATFVRWPWPWRKLVLTLGSPPSEEFEKQQEGSGAKGMIPMMVQP